MTSNKPLKSNKNLVVKANRLMEAKFHFKLWEMRIFEQMVSMINKDAKEFKLCKIYIKDLIKFFNSKSNNDHLLIKNAANSLGDKKLHVSYVTEEGHKRWAKLSIFPTVSIPDSESRDEANAYVELEFHKDLKPYLLDLQANFKSYDIRNFRLLRSVYSLRMFILLKQYEVIGKRKFLIEDLKEVLGIEADQYKLYGDFKKRVIIKPQQELAKSCDISFSFKEHKEGRRVVALTFFIHPNDQKAVPNTPITIPITEGKQPLALDLFSGAKELEALYPLVQEWITMDTLRNWLNKYPIAQVKAGITYTLNQLETGTKIANVGGYMTKMVAQDNLKDGTAVRKAKEAKAKLKVKEAQQQKELLEAKYKQLLRELSDKENAFVDQLFEEQPNLKVEMIDKAKGKSMSGYNAQKSLAENLQSPRFLAAVRSTTIEAHRSQMEALYTYYQPLINKVKKSLEQL